MSTTVLLVVLALGGLAVGWFLNTVIVRLPDGASLRPPPRCPECEARLTPGNLVPVVSWLRLRGRCRSCGAPIPLGYPLVEVGNAVLWVAAGLRFGSRWVLLAYLFLFSVLLAQAVIDFELYRLLDRITYPAIMVSLVALPLVALTLEHPKGAVLGAAVGGVGYFLFLFLPALVFPRGMGLGDAKLAALMGLYLGLIHPVLVLYSVILACLLGLAAGVALFFARGRESRAFPFGPWLALGCVLAVLFHTSLLRAL